MSFEDEIKDRTEFMNDFVEGRLLTTRPIFESNTPLFAVARRWNSWYPSYFEVEGGCYALISKEKKPNVTVIDPGFGFMNTLRRTLRVEPQDIQNIVVTHFHPDHMAGLVQFITLAFQTNQPCSIYLNKTAYDFFKSFQGGQIKIYELCPGDTIRVTDSDERTDEITISPKVAHHSEIGLRHQSLGLVIDIRKKGMLPNEAYRIGLMGDTDGREEYMPNYLNDYKNTDILILHLGSFTEDNRFGKGDKHLYRKGVLQVLDQICKKKDTDFPKLKLVVLSEFGLELASLDEILEAMGNFYLSRQPQMVLFLSSSLKGRQKTTCQDHRNIFESAVFSSLACKSLDDFLKLDPNTDVSGLMENQITWAFLILSLNRQEHLDKKCVLEEWLKEYVPLGALRQSTSEYIKSEAYEKALNNAPIHQGILSLASALLWGSGKERMDTIAQTRRFAEKMYQISQDIFHNKFAPSPALYTTVMKETSSFVESLGLVEKQDLVSIDKIELKHFSRLSMLGAAMLYDVIERAGISEMIKYKNNCLLGISDYFYVGTSLKDRGIRILPGDKGLVITLMGSRPLIVDSIGNLVDFDKITVSLASGGRSIQYRGLPMP
jgi:phosphoribosyl 1,2-cyclic phosphodiesterase